MRSKRTAFCLAALGAVLALTSASEAQLKNFIVPKAAATGGNSALGNEMPFAGGLVRYQQFYKAADIAKSVGPVRLAGLRFRSKSSNNKGYSVTLTLTIGRLKSTRSIVFANNLSDSSIVVAKRTVSLPTSTAGSWDLSLPFDTGKEFVWDGKSDLVMDVSVSANGNGGKKFFYFFDSMANDPSKAVSMQYASGTSATRATFVLANAGLVTRFDYRTGVAHNYGAGCKGDGGVVPKIGATGIPVVGNQQFVVTLKQAAPQQPVVLLWGFSDAKWGGVLNLPFNLTSIGIHGCSMFADPAFSSPTVAIGGAPGSGIASISAPILAIGSLVGLKVFGQWIVVDPSVKRPIKLTLSDALMVVIG